MQHNTLLRFVFSLFMSFLMSAFMTCWVTWLNLGTNFSLVRWGYAFIHAWPAAFVVVFFCASFVQKFSSLVLCALVKVFNKESRC